MADIVTVLRAQLQALALPWAAVTVWGFRDAALTFNAAEHGHLVSGDNQYTIVVFPGDRAWYMQAADTPP